jgi:hypothetical protein
MKPLPDLQDIEAMAARGRRSVLLSARNTTLEMLRDDFTRLQSAGIEEMDLLTPAIEESAERLAEISRLWREQDSPAA